MGNKIRNWSFTLFICLSFIACSSDDDNTLPVSTEPDTDYVVMLYGCGGGNLDADLMYNLDQVEGYGYSSKVRFTALVKYSSTFQNEDDLKGTRLYNMTERGMMQEEVYGSNYRLDNPDHIAAFIKSTKERLPAKKYILVLWNHGSEFDLWDQPLGWSDYHESTRGLVMDDNCTENGVTSAISIFELEEGLKRSGVKLDMIYWDVCLMNMIENIYQIKDYTNYVMGSAHLTPGIGGNYASLMHALDNHKDIPSAMQEYVPATISHWRDIYGTEGKDLALVDMSKIDATVADFKEVSDAFIKMKQQFVPNSQDALMFDYIIPYSAYWFDPEESNTAKNSVDMVYFVKFLSNNMLNGNLSAKVTKFCRSMDDMILTRGGIGLPDNMSSFSLGFCMMTKKRYEKTYSDIKGYSTIYPLLRFAKATGWNNFLKINDWKPVKYNEKTGELELKNTLLSM